MNALETKLKQHPVTSAKSVNTTPKRSPTNVDLTPPKKSSPIDRLKQKLNFHTNKSPSKPLQWQDDEKSVRVGIKSFNVKYLGCIEVQESRGINVCEQAIQVLLNKKDKHIKAILHISSDALRVVDERNKCLIVDQTIEKVSFCAPDNHHKKGFAYICRDGTTRRWLCHGFIALTETGERLSHTVGCAFQICLEKKQKRDQQCNVTVEYTSNGTSFTKFGSFRTTSITERMIDPQCAFIADPIPSTPVNSKNNFIERPRPKGNSPDVFLRSTSMHMNDFNQITMNTYKGQNYDLSLIEKTKYKNSLSNPILEEDEIILKTNDFPKLSLFDSTNTYNHSIDPFSSYIAQFQSPDINFRQSKPSTNPFDDDI